ncbi:hypothetical protein [Sphingobacterium sp. SGR-19]|uniref:hypothetical protein n=1 Tax=Sphingobacterium sp. SGR-19 TaxID=2710886 RepID=UPI0013E9AA0F|nr:hypothetical protein [Sphingobacterium sp. SGR-19]NGM67125.1 hypothetical protein [Sphingobacterium sp. SGR-19]
MSLIALSVFGAAVFVAEVAFGVLAVAGLAGVALLATVAAGFAALSVFGTAVFVAEVAFGLLAVAGLAGVALLAAVAAGFAALFVFGAAVFFAEAVFGLLAVAGLATVVLSTVSVGFTDDAAVSLSGSFSGFDFFSVAMKICLNKLKLSVSVLNITKTNNFS